MKSPAHVESPVGTALVHPRRKGGQAKLGRGGRQAVHLTKSDLEKLMHLRLPEASRQLGLSTTTVKKVCRTLGIYKWDKAESSRAESQSFFDNRRALPALSHTSEHASCMAAGSGVGLGISYTASTAAEHEPADNAPSPNASSSTVTKVAKVSHDPAPSSSCLPPPPSTASTLPPLPTCPAFPRTTAPRTVHGGRGADPSETLNPTP